MAITTGGLFYITFRDALDTGQLAIDLELETHKLALFTDTLAPTFATDTKWNVSPYDANETSGGSWSAGGNAVLTTSTLSVENSEDLTWDCDDVSVGTTDITAAMCGVAYADALADELLVLIDFVTAVTTVNGTFEITWTAPGSGGVFNIDLVG